jgi:hypothetical protein
MLIFCGARVTADQVGYELRGHPAPESPSAESGRGAPACFLSGISGWFSLSLGAWVATFQFTLPVEPTGCRPESGWNFAWRVLRVT